VDLCSKDYPHLRDHRALEHSWQSYNRAAEVPAVLTDIGGIDPGLHSTIIRPHLQDPYLRGRG
jgi:hypothetical protein